MTNHHLTNPNHDTQEHIMTQTTQTAATVLQRAIDAGQPIPNVQVELPIVGARRVNSKSGSGFRILLDVRGMTIPVTVWSEDAPALTHALQIARRDSNGNPVLPLILSGKQGKSRVVGDVTVPGYYNLNGRVQPANPFADLGIDLAAQEA